MVTKKKKKKECKEEEEEERDMVVIREFDEKRDIQVVGKLEKKCETDTQPKGWSNNKHMDNNNHNNNMTSSTTSKKGSCSLSTSMISEDPLCRIRFYDLHIMLVAELRENGEVVGMVRGCIKRVGTNKSGDTYFNLGSISGLRVSPSHRRMGIGLRLVKSIEEWMVINGAHYTILATEKNNVASTNLFTTKCNYIHFCSLVIFCQPIRIPLKTLSSQDAIKIEKLDIDQAVSLYNNKITAKDMYPTNMDSILKEKLSLGTWVSYFKEDNEVEDFFTKPPSSWVVFSVWNSCEAYKLFEIRKSHSPLKFFHATLCQAKEKIFPCVKLPISCGSLDTPFGFLFLYGLYGEGDGERLGELMRSAFRFASGLAESVKHCKVIMTELGVNDPLFHHVPQEPYISCIDDLWYLKKMNGDDHEMMMMGQIGNVLVDPRDF